MKTSRSGAFLVLVPIILSGAIDSHRAFAATGLRAPAMQSPPSPPPAAIGAPFKVSLTEAIFLGLRDNRAIKSAYLERVAERYDLFVAQRRFLPRATISATGGTTLPGSTFSATPTATWLSPIGTQVQFAWARVDTRAKTLNSDTETATLNVVQPLLRGAGLAVNEAPVRIAELQEKIDQLNLGAGVINTVTEIITAYRALLLAQEQTNIAKTALDRAARQLDLNQSLVGAGRMAAADMLQTEADIATQKVSALQSEQERASAQIALLRLLDMDPHIDVVAGDPIEAVHAPPDPEKALSIALRRRTDYLSQQAGVETARQNLLVAKNNELWDLSVVGSYQYEKDHGGSQIVTDASTGALVPSSILPTSSGSVGLQLNIPIGDYTLRQARVRASVSLRESENQLHELHRQIEAQVQDAINQTEHGWAQVEASREARRLAEKLLAVERERLAAGRASNFEVLTFETSLRNAETQLAANTVAYMNALTALDQLLGTTLDTWKIKLNDGG